MRAVCTHATINWPGLITYSTEVNYCVKFITFMKDFWKQQKPVDFMAPSFSPLEH